MTLDTPGILSIVALICAAGATVLLLWYLIRRPPLTGVTKLLLFLGLGPISIAAAMTGNVANFEVTKERKFCGSCHVMVPYTDDAADMKSGTLAALHSKNPYFGGDSCYVCHADYGMFGTITTKLGGLHHVWDYFTDDWDAPGHRAPELYNPYSNQTCQQCHPQVRLRPPLEHVVHKDAVASNQVSCASMGCHGPVHPGHERAKPEDATSGGARPASTRGEGTEPTGARIEGAGSQGARVEGEGS